MGLASNVIQFYLLDVIKKTTTENTSVCCLCFTKQTVRLNKTVKSY